MQLLQPHLRRVTVILGAGAFTTGINISALVPLITDIGAHFELSPAKVGQLTTAYAVVAFLTALLVAPFIDRFPRRTVLRVECALVAAAALLSAFATSYEMLLAGRALAGLGGALIAAICLAMAADLYPQGRQLDHAIGVLVATFSLAAIVGLPIITQIGAEASWRWALGVLALPAVAVMIATWWLPETDTGTSGLARHHRHMLQVFTSRRVNLELVAIFLVFVAMAGWLIYAGAFAMLQLGADADALSLIFIAAGVSQLIAGLVEERLLAVMSPTRLFVVLTLVLTACLVGATFLNDEWWPLVPIFALLGFSIVVLNVVCAEGLLASMPTRHGAVMALQSATIQAGIAVGAAVTGAILSSTNSFDDTFRLLAVLLPVSLGLLLLSQREPRPHHLRDEEELAVAPTPANG